MNITRRRLDYRIIFKNRMHLGKEKILNLIVLVKLLHVLPINPRINDYFLEIFE